MSMAIAEGKSRTITHVPIGPKSKWHSWRKETPGKTLEIVHERTRWRGEVVSQHDRAEQTLALEPERLRGARKVLDFGGITPNKLLVFDLGGVPFAARVTTDGSFELYEAEEV